MVLVVWIQSLRLLSEFVNRDLSYDQREVLSLSLLLLVELCCNMCLVRELELAIHIVVSMRVFLDAIFRLLAIFNSLFLRLYFLLKVLVVLEELLCINFANLFEWNVWCFVLESTVDKNLVIGCPARMSKSLDGVELVPLG